MDRVEILETQLALQREELKKQSDMISKMFEMMSSMHKSAPLPNVVGSPQSNTYLSPPRDKAIGESNISSNSSVSEKRDPVHISSVQESCTLSSNSAPLSSSSLPPPSTSKPVSIFHPVFVSSTNPQQYILPRASSGVVVSNVPVISKHMSSKRKAIRATRKFIKKNYDNVPLVRAKIVGSSNVSINGRKRSRNSISDCDSTGQIAPPAPAGWKYESKSGSNASAAVCAIPMSNAGHAPGVPTLQIAAASHSNALLPSSASSLSANSIPVCSASVPSPELADASCTHHAKSTTVVSNVRSSVAQSATICGIIAGEAKTEISQCVSQSDLSRLMASKGTLLERRRAVLQMLQALNQPSNTAVEARDEMHFQARDFYRDYLCFNGGQQVIADWLHATVETVSALLESSSSEDASISRSSSGFVDEESSQREYISLLLLLMEQVSWSPYQVAKTRIDKTIRSLYKVYIAHGEKLDQAQRALASGRSDLQFSNSSTDFAHTLREPWSKYREIFLSR